MSDSASGRPTAGALLQQQLQGAVDKLPKERDLRPLRDLAPFLTRHWKDGLWATLFMLLSAGSTLGITFALRLLVNNGFSSTPAGAAAPAATDAGAALPREISDALTSVRLDAVNQHYAFLLGLALVLAASTALRYLFVARLGERTIADMRQALYRHVLELDQAFFLRVRGGEVLSRLTTDMAVVETLVGASVSVAIRNLLTLIGALILLMFVSVTLTMLVLLLLLGVLLPLFLFGKRVRRLSTEASDKFAEAVAYAGETLEGLETVQAFHREDLTSSNFNQRIENAFEASQARVRARAIMTGMVIGFVFLGILGVFWLGSRSVVGGEGGLSGGELVQFFFLAVLAAGSVADLSESWGEIQKASGAMQRITELLAQRSSVSAPPNPTPLPSPPRGEISFQDVTFRYPGREEDPALTGFTLHVKAGETVALVGPSGAGKSTVFRLILRGFDPDSGTVSMDGVDLRQTDPTEVRSRLSLVAQDAHLFSGTPAENIRFGREEASDEEIRQAARDAQADNFIHALPLGYGTPLGDRGKGLSGGQKQRLAIARALVRDAPILLLDEATSALDAESERLVQEALERAMTGRTTVVIAHRLATVLQADRIIVMQGGRVVEEGTHHELTAREGLYARLARLQFSDAV